MWGNFVHRTLAFIAKYRDGVLPTSPVSPEIREQAIRAYTKVGERIEKGCFKDALETIFELVRLGNKYYDAAQPWKTRTSDLKACDQTLADCAYLIANLATLLHPFLPFSCEKIFGWLGNGTAWEEQTVAAQTLPEDLSVLYERMEETD